MEKFRYEANGYSRKDVNDFVSYVIGEMEQLIEKVRLQRLEIDALKEDIKNYQLQEHLVEESFQRISETGNNIRTLALEEKNLIVDEAKQYASRIINDALLRAEAIDSETIKFEKNTKLWKNQLEKIIEEEQSVLNRLNQMDISSE